MDEHCLICSGPRAGRLVRRRATASLAAWLTTLAVALQAAAAAAPDRPAVAVLPPVLPPAEMRHEPRATELVDLVQAALAADSRLRVVERADIRRVLDEQRRGLALGAAGSAGAAGSVAVGRAVGADLIVQPQFVLDGDAWSLRMNVIDPEKADHLGASVTQLAGDRKAGPTGPPPEPWVAAVGERLHQVAGQLPALRKATAVGLLFFANRTESSNRLDPFARALVDGIDQAERPGLRVLRFATVEPARGEQQLALAGITAGADRWQDVARWWVWGEFREVDWEGKPFAEGGIVVRANVWDGAHEPVVIEERGTVAGRAALAARVGERVAAAVSAAPAGNPLAAGQLADRLLAQARAALTEGIGGQWGATPAWLGRWRETCLLLDLARFLAPDNREVALEWLRTRFREDMSKTAGPTSGTGYLDEPEKLWHLRRAAAWGEFVDRFGPDGTWPRAWPGRPRTADNRVDGSSVASIYVRSAGDVLASFTEHVQSTHQSTKWNLDPKAREALRSAWAEEADRRLSFVIGKGAASPESLASLVSEMVRHMPDRPDVAKRLVADVVLKSDVSAIENPGPLAAAIRVLGNASRDPEWAERMTARLPAAAQPKPRAVAQAPQAPGSRPAAVGTRPVAAAPPPPSARPRPEPPPPPAAQNPNNPPPAKPDGIDLTNRFSVTVSAIAAWNDTWLIGAHGQDLGTAGMDLGNFVFQKLADHKTGFARIDKGIMMPAGVSAVAQHESLVWMVSAGSGIAQIDLVTSRYKHWGPTSGLPVEAFADIDLDPDRVPFAVSGENVSPPVLVYRPADRWLPLKVATFADDPRSGPSAERVAASRRAVLVAGDHHGVSPFASLWRRDRNDWVNVRANLLRHLAENKLDANRVTFGIERFNVLDAVALPAGGFILAHDVGATWVDDDGVPQRTTEWGENRQFAKFGQCLLSRDGSRVWVAGTVEPAGGVGVRGMAQGAPVVIELPTQPGGKPTFFDMPAGLRTPLRLAQNGDRLLAGGDAERPHVIFLPLRAGSLGR